MALGVGGGSDGVGSGGTQGDYPGVGGIILTVFRKFVLILTQKKRYVRTLNEFCNLSV